MLYPGYNQPDESAIVIDSIVISMLRDSHKFIYKFYVVF